MPKRDAHLQFEKWAREYGKSSSHLHPLFHFTSDELALTPSIGDVYSLMLGSKTLIVLSSDVAVKELLDRRSAIYSDRPEAYVGQDLCSGGLRMLFMVSRDFACKVIYAKLLQLTSLDRIMDQHGEWYEKKYPLTSDSVAMLTKTTQTRKMIHNLLNLNVAKKYVPYQMLENKQMLNDLLDTPDDFLEHIRRYSNALTTSMVFGWRTPTYADAKMQQLFDGFGRFADINQTGVAALVDFFPWLRWLPDWALTMQAYAKKLHREERKLYVGHWMKAKEEIKAGTISHCFCVGMAETQEKEGFSDAQAVSLIVLRTTWCKYLVGRQLP